MRPSAASVQALDVRLQQRLHAGLERLGIRGTPVMISRVNGIAGGPLTAEQQLGAHVVADGLLGVIGSRHVAHAGQPLVHHAIQHGGEGFLAGPVVEQVLA